jgi:hypothetical protein
MNNSRTEQWRRLMDLLDEADALQQELVTNPRSSYDYHSQLTNMMDDFEILALQEKE